MVRGLIAVFLLPYYIQCMAWLPDPPEVELAPEFEVGTGLDFVLEIALNECEVCCDQVFAPPPSVLNTPYIPPQNHPIKSERFSSIHIYIEPPIPPPETIT